MKIISIKGQEYEVISSRPFAHKGKQRTELKLRKPNGCRFYFAVVYENGAVGEAV